MGTWFPAKAGIEPEDDLERLTGLEIRERFFFGTTPGNSTLYVSEPKSGLFAIMPAN